MMGTRVVRREDPRLITGTGAYVADLDVAELDGAAAVTFVRSTIAHARLLDVDVSEAMAMPGVIAVLTHEDLTLAAPRPRLPWVPPETTRPWLATGRVRFVGEPIALVVAETITQATDVAEMVIVDYDPLDAIVDPEAALAAEAPLLFDGLDSNLACETVPERYEHLFDGL